MESGNGEDMDSDLNLKITRKKDEIPIIGLSFSQKRYKKIVEHVSSMTEEELAQALEDLERQIIRRENGSN